MVPAGNNTMNGVCANRLEVWLFSWTSETEMKMVKRPYGPYHKVIITCARKGSTFWPSAIFMPPWIKWSYMYIALGQYVCPLTLTFLWQDTMFIYLIYIHFGSSPFRKKSVLTSLWPWPWNPGWLAESWCLPSCVLF